MLIFRYDDNTRFEGKWEDAPGYGVQTIVYIDPIKGPTTRHQGYCYRLDEDGDVVVMDHDDLIHHVVDTLKIIKMGSMVSRHKWQRFLEHARADMAELLESIE